MLHPGIGVRGEVGVLLEDLVWWHKRRQLGKPAFGAHANVQGVERLHRFHVLGREKALAEWRLPEVDHRQLERRVADAAIGPAGYGCGWHTTNVARLGPCHYPRPGGHRH